MSKKNGILALAAVAAVILGIVLYKNANRGYSSFTAMGCSAIEYVQEEEAGYLIIMHGEDNREITVLVEDVELQQKIAENELGDVIGVK